MKTSKNREHRFRAVGLPHQSPKPQSKPVWPAKDGHPVETSDNALA